MTEVSEHRRCSLHTDPGIVFLPIELLLIQADLTNLRSRFENTILRS
jgi:hypothetical protein